MARAVEEAQHHILSAAAGGEDREGREGGREEGREGFLNDGGLHLKSVGGGEAVSAYLQMRRCVEEATLKLRALKEGERNVEEVREGVGGDMGGEGVGGRLEGRRKKLAAEQVALLAVTGKGGSADWPLLEVALANCCCTFQTFEKCDPTAPPAASVPLQFEAFEKCDATAPLAVSVPPAADAEVECLDSAVQVAGLGSRVCVA